MTNLEQIQQTTGLAEDRGSLLTAVLRAHGGLDNWAKVTRIKAQLSLGGIFWAARGWPDLYSRQTVTLDPHREHITIAPFTSRDRMSVFDVEPERVAITTQDGRILEERLLPRESFPAAFDTLTTPWDALQVAYFSSAALWNYLTTPFVFAQPDVEAREIAPWQDGAETWRRLAVKFPNTNANHNADQTFYYDESFLLRRMDYSPDVTGKAPVAHYCYDQKTFDGFVFPTRRRVLLHDANGVANHEFVPITIDVTDVSVD